MTYELTWYEARNDSDVEQPVEWSWRSITISDDEFEDVKNMEPFQLVAWLVDTGRTKLEFITEKKD